jgi:hypothetical protein
MARTISTKPRGPRVMARIERLETRLLTVAPAVLSKPPNSLQPSGMEVPAAQGQEIEQWPLTLGAEAVSVLSYLAPCSPVALMTFGVRNEYNTSECPGWCCPRPAYFIIRWPDGS